MLISSRYVFCLAILMKVLVMTTRSVLVAFESRTEADQPLGLLGKLRILALVIRCAIGLATQLGYLSVHVLDHGVHWESRCWLQRNRVPLSVSSHLE